MRRAHLAELLGGTVSRPAPAFGREPVTGKPAVVTPREKFEAEEKHRRAMRWFWIASAVAGLGGILYTARRVSLLEEQMARKAK